MTAGRWGLTLLTVAAGAYLATGVRAVQQDERGVVRRFGKVAAEPYPPGLHLGLPWGFEQVDRVKVDQARTLTVGAGGPQSAPLSRAPDPASDDFLTGDLNLVTAEAVVQFRVSDPVKYQFAARSADAELGALAESALTEAMASRAIDDVLTSGRAEAAEWLRRRVQTLADAQGLGVSVQAVRLARVTPPAPVAPAFADAARARSDRRQAVTRAEQYRDRARSDARGRARETADQAAGKAETAVQAARGEAGRFAKVLAAVGRDPRAARQRLYLEALAELLPRFRRKVVVAPGRDVDLSVMEEPAGPAPTEPANPAPTDASPGPGGTLPEPVPAGTSR